MTPRPSLIPAVVATAFAAVQTEIGPELAHLVVTIANIVAATVLAVLGQRLRRCQQELTERRPKRRTKKPTPRK